MSADMKIRRLAKEGQRLCKQIEDAGGIEAHLQKERWSVEVPQENLQAWRGFLLGPVGTPYEGQQYELSIHFDGINYPEVPPKVVFSKAIPFHANVYMSGQICIDILKSVEQGGAWSAVLKIGDILVSLVSMLNEPNTSSPANPDASRAYDGDQTKGKINFTKLATERYARQCLTPQ